MNNDNRYEARGVSAKKEDVHAAIKGLDRGIFPKAFCQIVPDHVGGDPNYCNIFHADGAGTKTSLAYIYYREAGDANIFEGIAQDCIVMNLDDVICVGAVDSFLISSLIDRNKHLIPVDVIAAIINGYTKFCDKMRSLGINIFTTGGETADLGDLVRTIVCDATIFARLRRKDVITGEKIRPNNVIVGLSSTGQASYEDVPNSGIGSNGLTLARHEVLARTYAKKYPESYDDVHVTDLAYVGSHEILEEPPGLGMSVGKALLSPTRTYAPIIREILSQVKEEISAIFHNTGGGQTKCLRFGEGVHYVKDNPFSTPPLFKLIKETSKVSWKEMYQVFNMGHRLELLCDESRAKDIIKIANKFKVEAQIIGHCERASNKNEATIQSEHGEFTYKL